MLIFKILHAKCFHQLHCLHKCDLFLQMVVYNLDRIRPAQHRVAAFFFFFFFVPVTHCFFFVCFLVYRTSFYAQPLSLFVLLENVEFLECRRSHITQFYIFRLILYLDLFLFNQVSLFFLLFFFRLLFLF